MTTLAEAATETVVRKTRLRDFDTVDTGAAGRIEIVELKQLRIDPLYQRDLIADFVEQMADNWDIVTAGTIVVSKRPNGDLFIVDGQHRAAAAVRAGESHILAQVLDEPSAEEEARLRLKGNFKKTDRIYEVFRARIAAGDPKAKKIKSILKNLDTQINYSPTAESGINAVAAIEKLYDLDDGVTLIRILSLLKDLFGPISPEYASSNTLKALAWFTARHELEIDQERFNRLLKAMGPSALGRSGRAHKASMGGSLWMNTYRALVTMYNEGLTDANKLEWRTKGASRWRPGEGNSGND
jgi:hypothetical protein